MLTLPKNQRVLDREIHSIVKKADDTDRFSSPGKQVTFSEFLSNKLLMMLVIRKGIPYSFFKLILEYAPLSESDWAELLELSSKSLQRYKQSARSFRSIHSEKIIEMAEVTSVGIEVFGDAEKFRLWLNTPSFALGNLKPIEFLRDSYGKEMVITELTRINHGIFA